MLGEHDPRAAEEIAELERERDEALRATDTYGNETRVWKSRVDELTGERDEARAASAAWMEKFIVQRGQGPSVDTHLRVLKERERLRARVAELEAGRG